MKKTCCDYLLVILIVLVALFAAIGEQIYVRNYAIDGDFSQDSYLTWLIGLTLSIALAVAVGTICVASAICLYQCSSDICEEYKKYRK